MSQFNKGSRFHNKTFCIDNLNKAKYATVGSSGIDIQSNIYKVIKPKSCCYINTAFYFHLNDADAAQIRSKSGLALKLGLVVLNFKVYQKSKLYKVKVHLANVSQHTIYVSPEKPTICFWNI